MLADRPELRATLLRVWAEWDDAAMRLNDRRMRGVDQRTLEAQAQAMERASGDYASLLLLTTTQLRDVLTAFRRCGWSRAEALRAVEVAVEDRNRE